MRRCIRWVAGDENQKSKVARKPVCCVEATPPTRKLPELQNFRFVDTTVVDGDLTPLLKLQFVGFVGKKHYSHTPKQMDAIFKQHGGCAP